MILNKKGNPDRAMWKIARIGRGNAKKRGNKKSSKSISIILYVKYEMHFKWNVKKQYSSSRWEDGTIMSYYNEVLCCMQDMPMPHQRFDFDFDFDFNFDFDHDLAPIFHHGPFHYISPTVVINSALTTSISFNSNSNHCPKWSPWTTTNHSVTSTKQC